MGFLTPRATRACVFFSLNQTSGAVTRHVSESESVIEIAEYRRGTPMRTCRTLDSAFYRCCRTSSASSSVVSLPRSLCCVSLRSLRFKAEKGPASCCTNDDTGPRFLAVRTFKSISAPVDVVMMGGTVGVGACRDRDLAGAGAGAGTGAGVTAGVAAGAVLAAGDAGTESGGDGSAPHFCTAGASEREDSTPSANETRRLCSLSVRSVLPGVVVISSHCFWACATDFF